MQLMELSALVTGESMLGALDILLQPVSAATELAASGERALGTSGSVCRHSCAATSTITALFLTAIHTRRSRISHEEFVPPETRAG